MKALLVLALLAAIRIGCVADTIQVNLGGNLTLNGPLGAPLTTSDNDPFDASVSASLPTPFTYSLTYNTNAQPNVFGIYPGITDTLNFGDYHETGTSSEIIPEVYGMMKIFTSSFVLLGGLQFNQTIYLNSRTSSLSFSTLQNVTLPEISPGSGIGFESYQPFEDDLNGPITSFYTVDLSVPEPSVGAMLLISLSMIAVTRRRFLRYLGMARLF